MTNYKKAICYILFPFALLALSVYSYMIHQAKDDWRFYKNKFITANGRVIDTGNGGISHSEGQGYGMLLAVHYGDRVVFDRLWQWTRKNLQRPHDYLFSWRYEPGQGVTDKNNASDGDILIAWALLQAATKWEKQDYLRHSKNILIDIRNKLMRQWRDLSILLPGEAGFADNGNLTVNLSYWIYPAFVDFHQADPSPVWHDIIASGLKLQQQARFGKWHLVPDWIDLGKEEISISSKYKPFSGYDAIRVPLYQFWAGRLSREYARNYLALQEYSIATYGFPTAEVNLVDDKLAEYEAPKGIKAVIDLQRALVNDQAFAPAPLGASDDYYSATLCLLTFLAAQETNE